MQSCTMLMIGETLRVLELSSRLSEGAERLMEIKHVLVKVRVVISCEARYGFRGQRVGEASHPGPMRRLRRSADVRNVFQD